MINVHEDMVKALNTVLPTYYELVLTQGTKTPCISYQETNNYVVDNGDTLGYSRISYTIKVWGHDMAEIMKYVLQIDATLRPLGWKRIATGELYDRNSTMIQKILTYEALALEQF